MFKLSKLIAFSVFYTWLTFPLISQAKELDNLRGIEHPPMPAEINETGGWSVHKEIVNRTHSITSASVDGQRLLFLDRIIGRDSSGKPFFQVVNVLPLPPIDNQKEDILGGSPYQCRINEREYDPTLIVIAQLEDGNTEFLTKVRRAWRVDLENEQFNEINLQGLEFKCENMGFGL